jgi:hypothetical protein
LRIEENDAISDAEVAARLFERGLTEGDHQTGGTGRARRRLERAGAGDTFVRELARSWAQAVDQTRAEPAAPAALILTGGRKLSVWTLLGALAFGLWNSGVVCTRVITKGRALARRTGGEATTLALPRVFAGRQTAGAVGGAQTLGADPAVVVLDRHVGERYVGERYVARVRRVSFSAAASFQAFSARFAAGEEQESDRKNPHASLYSRTGRSGFAL